MFEWYQKGQWTQRAAAIATCWSLRNIQDGGGNERLMFGKRRALQHEEIV